MTDRFQIALAHHEAGRLAAARAEYKRVIAANPRHADALHLLGVTHAQQQSPKAAADLIARAIAFAPGVAAYHSNLGASLRELGRLEEALASLDRALALQPVYADALVHRGNTLRDLGRVEAALASYEAALALRPDPLVSMSAGGILRNLGRQADALVHYDAALAQRLNADWLMERGHLLAFVKRFADAAASFALALQVEPETPYALGQIQHALASACEWSRYDEITGEVTAAVRAGRRVIPPWPFLLMSDSPADQLQCARTYAAERHAEALPPLWTGEAYDHQRIRIAYVSGDFQEHATAYLMAGLFEAHDRSRFEIIGVCLEPDPDASPMRARLSQAFDQFIDMSGESDLAVAQRLRALEADIAVDLGGYAGKARMEIFRRRPAPLQVSYIGFPGTLGLDCIDYLIADAHLIPVGQERFYTEQIVRLPGSYQVNDDRRLIPAATPTRAEAGLPAEGFVFCSFNNSFKITPAVFNVWMRLLKAVEGSVLWLLLDSRTAAANLRREAAARGVLAERLIFAERVPLYQHLARHRFADLCLDTLPCNAHTTASDALRMGSPMVTVSGQAFAGRVCGSLLHAVGLSDLVESDLAAYEASALLLALNPAVLAEVRARLAANFATHSLFDTDRFRRHLEQAFETLHARHRQGLPPAGFDVAALPA